jgi:hypothetical protein
VTGARRAATDEFSNEAMRAMNQGQSWLDANTFKRGFHMNYRVLPFVANVAAAGADAAVATQLQDLCQKQASDGFEFVGLESVETWVAGSNGCFGFNKQPADHRSYSVAVFRK